MDFKDIGERLRATRGERTMQEAASLLGIHVNSLYLYETGKQAPRVPLMLKLVELWGVDLHWLLTGKAPRAGRVKVIVEGPVNVTTEWTQSEST